MKHNPQYYGFHVLLLSPYYRKLYLNTINLKALSNTFFSLLGTLQQTREFWNFYKVCLNIWHYDIVITSIFCSHLHEIYYFLLEFIFCNKFYNYFLQYTMNKSSHILNEFSRFCVSLYFLTLNFLVCHFCSTVRRKK